MINVTHIVIFPSRYNGGLDKVKLITDMSDPYFASGNLELSFKIESKKTLYFLAKKFPGIPYSYRE